MTTGISSPLALSGLYASVDGRYLAANGKPFTSVSNAESALNGFPSKLSESCVGLTVLVKESGWTEAKEYWVQPKGTTPETYGLVEKGAGVTDYNDLDNKPTIGDGTNTALPIVGNVKVSASTASGSTAGVTVTPGQNTGEIEMQFTLPKGADGADGQDGAPGAPGHNPNLGIFLDTDTNKPTTGQTGDYFIVIDTTDQQRTASVWAWNENAFADTEKSVENFGVQFASGQPVVDVHIKDENGDDDHNAQGVLGADAGADIVELNSAKEQLTASYTDNPVNWMDFDSDDVKNGYYLHPTSGGLVSNENYVTSGYIPVKTGETYRIKFFDNYTNPATAFYYGIIEYDEDKTMLRVAANAGSDGTYMAYTPSSDAKYFRFSSLIQRMRDGHTVLYYGDTPSSYSAYYPPHKVFELKDNSISSNNLKDDSVTGQKVKDSSININKLSFTEDEYGKNLFDGTLISQRFINSSGNQASGPNYMCSNKINVIPGEPYHISLDGDNIVGTNSTYIAFYSDGVFVSAVTANRNQVTIPEDANQIAFSVYNSYYETHGDLQLERGTTRTSYEEYHYRKVISNDFIPELGENTVGTEQVKDRAITQNKLSENITVKSAPNKFNGWQNSGEIAAGESLQSSKYFRCRKGFVAVAMITGTIESVRFHVMDGSQSIFKDWYIDLDQTNLNVISYPGNVSTPIEYAHGLQLGEFTTIIVDMGNGSSSGAETTIRIIDDAGNVYSRTGVNFTWGCGYVKMENNNTSGNLSVKLSAFNKNLDKKIWLFGDSYLTYGDPMKWITHIFNWSYHKLLLDHMPGETSSQSLSDLNTLLESGAKPSYIIWCLGMNGGSDTNDQVNPNWLNITNQVETICQNNGIELILATIPTVPSYSHVKLNEWVRNSGHRYIDIADAVEDPNDAETDHPNHWKYWGESNQLLNNDLVHTTQYGAVAIAARVLIDFPEITSINQ